MCARAVDKAMARNSKVTASPSPALHAQNSVQGLKDMATNVAEYNRLSSPHRGDQNEWHHKQCQPSTKDTKAAKSNATDETGAGTNTNTIAITTQLTGTAMQCWGGLLCLISLRSQWGRHTTGRGRFPLKTMLASLSVDNAMILCRMEESAPTMLRHCRRGF